MERIKTEIMDLAGLNNLKADMGKRGYDAMVILTSAKASTSCYRSATTGRLTYLSGSVALFIRHDDLREGR